MTFWLIWSGMFDPFHIGLGVISVAMVVRWTGHLFIEQSHSLGQRIDEWLRFEVYSFWLVWQIVLANYDMFKLAFHPNVLREINPQFVSFKTPIVGDVPQFVLAQSITLTPGTVTVSLQNGEFKIHAINDATAKALPGDMQARVQAIYRGHSHA
jgi:multicomponent Na+:H+ antiporter subunit E